MDLIKRQGKVDFFYCQCSSLKLLGKPLMVPPFSLFIHLHSYSSLLLAINSLVQMMDLKLPALQLVYVGFDILLGGDLH